VCWHALSWGGVSQRDMTVRLVGEHAASLGGPRTDIDV
jgi:hypothetical protein